MSAPSAAFKQFEKRIGVLATLIAKIPASIPVAKETDHINEIFQYPTSTMLTPTSLLPLCSTEEWIFFSAKMYATQMGAS
jgi:hypothetical protein